MGFFDRSKKKQSPQALPSKVDQFRPPQRQCGHHDGTPRALIPLQPAGYLQPPPPPPPPIWNNTHPPPGTSPPQYHEQQRPSYPPIVVNQHYYLSPPPPNPYSNNNGSCALSKLKLGSAVDLANEIIPGNVVHQVFDDGLPKWHAYGTQLLNQSAAMYDQIWNRFNDVMTLIDRERFVGNENALFMYQPSSMPSPPSDPPQQPNQAKGASKKNKRDAPKGQTSAVASSLISGGYFSKVELYANSRLPPNLTPLHLHIPHYPLLCLAAQYSERVYEKPRGAERDTHVDADWRAGTKAMRIKSVPMDHMNTIVFAIRGTATFMDWAVNLNTAPTAPTRFLDDASNFCHAGFLSVARKMIAPVAARLRQLLEEDPGRCSYSLLITGHSAGGAIASLLFSHMLATSKAAASELNNLTGCFKRVHCITFGTPPVSLFPLQKPDRSEFKKFLFLSFVNEGDPVARADKAYVRSLLELFAAPAPAPAPAPSAEARESGKLLLSPPPPSPPSKKHHDKPREKKSRSSLASKTSKISMRSSHSSSHSHSHSHPSPKKTTSRSFSGPPPAPPAGPVWKVPPNLLSNAGQIVVLRAGGAQFKRAKTVEERLGEGVVAQVASDELLRGLVWGDPVCHVMKLYAGRIEVLAVSAVTGKGR
ncbi:alpha/beta-hydrolase [Xylariaceae sp. FL0662B]|nr:alpha/beta-hydrolase [Xylariaceae sp. FL0662B]